MSTLCIIDDSPRHLTGDDIRILQSAALLVETLLDGRGAVRAARKVTDERQSGFDKLDRTYRQFRQAERMANIGSWRLKLAANQVECSDQTYAVHPAEDGPRSTPPSTYIQPNRRSDAITIECGLQFRLCAWARSGVSSIRRHRSATAAEVTTAFGQTLSPSSTRLRAGRLLRIACANVCGSIERRTIRRNRKVFRVSIQRPQRCGGKTTAVGGGMRNRK